MEMADVKKNMESNVPVTVTVSSLESPAGCPSGCIEERDLYIVDFEDPDDPASPATWSKTRKWCTVGLLSSMMLVVTLTTVICTPISPVIEVEFQSDNHVYPTLFVSVMEFGMILGPLLIAPLSELYGRTRVYNTGNILFVLFTIAGGLSRNFEMLIAFRFLTGVALAPITLNPIIIGDMFIQEQRGTAMSITAIAPLLGPIAGPVIGGYLTETRGWRWTFWFPAILGACCAFSLLIFLRESYKVTIIDRKATKLQKQTGLPFRSVYDLNLSGSQVFKKAIVRPLKIITQSPMVVLLGIYLAMVYGYLYLLLTTMAEVFGKTYHFSTGPVGLMFLGLGVGMALGLAFCKTTLDSYIKKQKDKAGGMQPEHRLFPLLLGGLLMPVGLFTYGWTAQTHVQWMAPIVGTSLVGFGLTVTNVPVLSYMVDAFGVYAASAVAASMILRCIGGAVLPLAGPPLYSALGLGWGNSVLAFIALLFIPLLLLLMKYGGRLRQGSNFQIHF